MIMDDKQCVEELEEIKQTFIAGTNGCYPQCLEYAINRIKSLYELPSAENISKKKAINELEFLMEGYRQLLSCAWLHTKCHASRPTSP